MRNAIHRLRVILIGGTSHTGKSTLAQSLALTPGWSFASTDMFARHPGRPWKEMPERVPEHVAEYYLSWPVEELLTDVLQHYRNNVWPIVERSVFLHAQDPSTDCLALEGSALWPEWVVTLKLDNLSAIWLTANEDFIAERIRLESQYCGKPPREKEMIDNFLNRTLDYNQGMMEVVHRLGLPHIDVTGTSSLEELTGQCLDLLGRKG